MAIQTGFAAAVFSVALVISKFRRQRTEGEAMRFACCTEEIEISGIRKCFESAMPGSVNLGLGQPDFDTPSHIKRAAIRAIEMGQCGYTPNCGVPALREALAEKLMRENQIDCTADDIMVTSGASEALFLAIVALVDRWRGGAGGRSKFPFSYAELTRLVGQGPSPSLRRGPLTTPENWGANNKKTRMIIINSPSNPTGSVQTEEQMRAIAEIADDEDIALLSDEVPIWFHLPGRAYQPG